MSGVSALFLRRDRLSRFGKQLRYEPLSFGNSFDFDGDCFHAVLESLESVIRVTCDLLLRLGSSALSAKALPCVHNAEYHQDGNSSGRETRFEVVAGRRLVRRSL